MEVENNCQLTPVLTIQCNWEDFIDVPQKPIWVSCKYKGQTSVHGSIRGGSLASDTEDFTATIGRNSICVKYNSANALYRFIPAFKVFSDVHSQGIISLDASEGGLGVSACSGNKLVVWDNATGEVRRELTGHVGVYKCRLFASGVVVLSGGADLKIKIWSAETGKCPVTLKGHTRAITDLSIIDRGRNIMSVSKDGTARLFHCADGDCIDTILRTSAQLNCCDIGPIPDGIETRPVINGREVGTQDKIALFGSEESEIYAVAMSTRQILYCIPTNSAVNAIVYLSKQQFVAGTEDGRVLIYNILNGSLLKCIDESESPVRSLAGFQGKGVLVGRQDGTVHYFSLLSNTQDRIQLTGSDCDPIYSISVTSSAVYTGCRDGKIRKYKVSDLLAGGA